MPETLRLVDLVDILLASVFIYGFIAWVRRSTTRAAARRLLVVVLGLVGLYALALELELFLVEVIVQVSLVLLVLGAAVVFQTDIRRMVDRLGSLRWGRAREVRPSSTVDLLTEAAFKMAEMRRGALIAVRGREPWDRHVEGGIRLGGQVSLPLVLSIFNPTSPGHDGAVLLDGDRVLRFGAHLPLSANLPAVSRYGGTRHAAALGLAEECDALVIVVSEERGRVSVAHRGQLTEMASGSDLKGVLGAFWREHYGVLTGETAAARRRRALQTSLLSLSLAALLWVVFAYRPDTIYRTFVVPIEYRNLKPQWALADPVPAEARITVAGSEQAFRQLNPASLVVSMDLARIEAGENELAVAEDNLKLPSGLSLYRVEPERLTVSARPEEALVLPIEVRTTGTLPDSLALVEIRTVPRQATVLVPEGQRRPPETIPTEPIDLGTLRGTTTIRSRLVPPDGARLPPAASPEVSVTVQVRPSTAPEG